VFGPYQPLEVVVTLFYPDCSNNNWASTQDALGFLKQLVPEGFSGICHKVSEGNYYEDPYWPAVKQWCATNNLPAIGYHYVTTDDAASQARTWLANQGGAAAMLDWETNSGDLANLIAVVDAFNTAGVTIQLGYYPRWYWNQQGGGDLSDLANALVSSGYPDGTGYAWTIYTSSAGDTGSGWAPYSGVTPAAWQFTDRADIAGLNVDCNAYLDTDLTVLFGTTPTSGPAPVNNPSTTPPSA
jgi:Glycosyl hydrolases family 25